MRASLLQALTVLVTMAIVDALSPGWAIRCDGVDDWATLPIPSLPESWTLEAWVKFNSFKTASVFHMHSGDNTVLRIVTSNSGGATQLQLAIGGGGTKPTGVKVTTEEFVHIAVVVERTEGIHVNTTMFINGTIAHFTTIQQLEIMRPPIQLGLCYTRKLLSSMDVREKFGDVEIDDVRLWGEARTEEQIYQTMETVPAGPNLLHWWAMDDGGGVVLTDSIQGYDGDLAKRRQFTTQRPMWVPSRARARQVNFTAISGVINKPIALSLHDGSATEPSTFTSTTANRIQIPYEVVATGERGTFDISVRQKRPPIAGENKGLRLNGFSAYGISTPFQIPTSFTIDMWLHPRSFLDGYMDFCSKHSLEASNIVLMEASLKNHRGFYEPTLNVRIGKGWYVGGELLFEPQHLAMVATADLVRNVTSCIMYRNGDVLWKEELADVLVYGEGLPWTMGQDYDNRNGVVPSDFFDGTLDEYRFWSRPLTQGEVQYSMTHAIDRGPDFPHLIKAYSFDSADIDDEYSIHGGALLEPCESGLEARPLQVFVEEGHNVTFTLPAMDPEDGTLTFSLVQEPSQGTAVLDPTKTEVLTYAAKENKNSVETLKYTVIDDYGQLARFPGNVLIHVLRHGPKILTLEAVRSEIGYDRGSAVRIIFSEPTNRPLENVIGGVVEFFPPIANRLALEWESATVLLAVVLEPLGSSSGLIGYTTVHIRGVVTAKDGLSVAVNATSPLLQGDWGEPVTLSALTIAMAVILPIAFVLFGVVIFVVRSKQRNLNNAPKDPTTPMTILFTDIESSTKLWSRNAEVMSRSLDIHHTVIRKAIRANSCYEVKTIGDAFMVACKSPSDAIQLALDIQTGLSDAFQNVLGKQIGIMYQHDANNDDETETNIVSGLRVRVGLHTGLADIQFDEVVKGYDYYGTTVNIASRVESAGHGGQIIATAESYEAVQGDFRGVVVKDLGVQLLRGVGNVALFEILPDCFSGRQFSLLRLDKIVDTPEDEELLEHSPEVPPARVTSLDLDASWVSARVHQHKLVLSGMVAADDLIIFIQPIVVAIRLLFSVGKESSKPVVKALCDKWNVPYGLHDAALRLLAFKIAVTSRERMEEDHVPHPARQNLTTSTPLRITDSGDYSQ
jgi:class 3 adenylate cyclase